MLLEIGIGDAYGAGFEFSTIEKVTKYNNLSSYQAHELGIPAGHYTDDTQMSLALAELLISGENWDRETIADKFVECFNRDKRPGYSKGFYAFLQSIKSGKEFLSKINHSSTRNGAAMRAAPLGIVKNVDDLLSMSEIQASLTHNTDIGIKSAQAVALSAHYFLYDKGNKSSLTEYVSDFTKHKWNDQWCSPVQCCGEETVNAILTALTNTSTLSELLITSVDFSGDVDTVSAVGLGIASVSDQYDKNLPRFLYEQLKKSTYGHDYLECIGNQLLRLSK